MRMGAFFSSAFVCLVGFLLISCASKKVQDPNAELKKNQAWVEKLPVAAGASLEQLAPKQRIHLTAVKEIQKRGDLWWIAAQGFAKVNNEIMPYFWRSSNPPNLEISVQLKSSSDFEGCRAVVEADVTADQVIEMLAEGEFAARMVNGKYLGVFKLVAVRGCEVLARDSYAIFWPEDFFASIKPMIALSKE